MGGLTYENLIHSFIKLLLNFNILNNMLNNYCRRRNKHTANIAQNSRIWWWWRTGQPYANNLL